MGELQELVQSDLGGQPNGRQIAFVHLVPRHQPAPPQLGERTAHDSRGEALASMLNRCDDASDFPDSPMVLERQAHGTRMPILFQRARERMAGRQQGTQPLSRMSLGLEQVQHRLGR